MSAMRRIDVHSHLIPDFYSKAVIDSGRGPTITTGYPHWSPSALISLMDQYDIEVSVLSISQPGVHFGDDGKADALALACNEYIADLCVKQPTRLGGFATLSLPDVDAACKQVEHALDVLKMDGVCMLASYGELFLGDPHFEPLMALLNHRKAVVFVHPNFHPSSKGVAQTLGTPAFMLEFPFDTTRAAVNMLLKGMLDRYPDIRFILSHAGGALPYLAWRVAQSPVIDARLPRLSPEEIFERLGRYYYDTAISAGPSTFGALEQIARPERILFGSDWPYAPEAVTKASIEALEKKSDFDAARQAAIARDNALALFPRFA